MKGVPEKITGNGGIHIIISVGYSVACDMMLQQSTRIVTTRIVCVQYNTCVTWTSVSDYTEIEVSNVQHRDRAERIYFGWEYDIEWTLRHSESHIDLLCV